MSLPITLWLIWLGVLGLFLHWTRVQIQLSRRVRRERATWEDAEALFVALVSIVTLGALLGLLLAQPAWALGHDRYDADIRQASERWLPGHDWVRYRALLWQESRLDPNATSPAGAEGIAQFMPGTWPTAAAAIGAGGLSPRMARPAIEAGAWYLGSRIRIWTEPRPDLERRRLGEACYNAGCGHVIKAQRLCRAYGVLECRDWHQISLFLPAVTGRHAAETLSYVASIEHWQRLMRAQGLR